jgi:hypothetical protein
MKILNFVVCDDIRQELGNKNTLIGVYDNLVIHKVPNVNSVVPAALKLAFFIRVKMEKEDSVVPDSFRFESFCNGKVINHAEGRFKIENNPTCNTQLAVLFNIFIIPQDAKQIEFKVYFNKDNKPVYTLSPEPLIVNFSDVKPG